MVEAPLALQEQMNMSTLPSSHLKACSAEQMPSGNKLDGGTSGDKETEDQTSTGQESSELKTK